MTDTIFVMEYSCLLVSFIFKIWGKLSTVIFSMAIKVTQNDIQTYFRHF